MKYGNSSLLKSIIASPVTMIGAVIILAIISKASWNIYDKARASSHRLSEARTEFLKLQGRQSELSAKVGYLSTDQGIETEIRTRYHAVKEGESVAVIIEESKVAAAVNDATSVQVASSTGWWSRMLRVVGF